MSSAENFARESWLRCILDGRMCVIIPPWSYELNWTGLWQYTNLDAILFNLKAVYNGSWEHGWEYTFEFLGFINQIIKSAIYYTRLNKYHFLINCWRFSQSKKCFRNAWPPPGHVVMPHTSPLSGPAITELTTVTRKLDDVQINAWF